MEPIRVAAVQMLSKPGAVEANAGRLIWLMDRAKAQGVHLLCFPEACLTGYRAFSPALIALSPNDPVIAHVEHEAARRHLAICYGYIEQGPGLTYLTQVVTDGEQRLVYRKTHLGHVESAFTAGDELPVAEIAGVVVGVQLCWESHIPDISAVLRAQGAELLLVPYASPKSGENRRCSWNRYLPARATDNGAYVLACNALARNDEGRLQGGGLAAYGPGGAVLNEYYRTDEHMLVCDLDGILPRDLPQNDMRAISYFDRRRPQLYAAALGAGEQAEDPPVS